MKLLQSKCPGFPTSRGRRWREQPGGWAGDTGEGRGRTGVHMWLWQEVRAEGGRMMGGGGGPRNQDVSAWCDVQRASARPGAALFLFWHTRDSLSVSLSLCLTHMHTHIDTHLLWIYIARTVNFLPPSCPFLTFFFLLHSFTQFFHWSFRQSPQLACEQNSRIHTPYPLFLHN